MKTDAVITVRGAQDALDGGRAEEVELTSAGRFYRQGEACYLIYDESAVTQLEGTRTTVKIESGVMKVIRSGRYPSTLVIEPGAKHSGPYSTAYGRVELTVAGRSLDISISDEGGQARAEYDLEVNGGFVSRNTLEITVKPVKEQK